MRMLQPGGNFDLIQEALWPDRGGQLRPQDLHCDVPPVLDVAGEKHHGHAAGTELALDLVAAGQSGLDRFDVDAHEGSPREAEGYAGCARATSEIAAPST